MLGNGVLSKNGYAQIPLLIKGKIQNLIVQWGEGNTNSTGRARVTLPISYPTENLFSLAIERDAESWFLRPWLTSWGVSSKDSTQSQITLCVRGISQGGGVDTGSFAYSYLSIGY